MDTWPVCWSIEDFRREYVADNALAALAVEAFPTARQRKYLSNEQVLNMMLAVAIAIPAA